MLRRLVTWMFYPSILIGGLSATLVGIRSGLPPTITVMTTIFLSAVPILLAQRWLPFEERWRARPRDFGLDLLHMASTATATEGYRALTVGLLTAAALWLQGSVGASLWPSGWPVWIQLALALIVGDFGAYWVHRLCHASPLMWRVHAMHHSSEKLYVFASARNHPMNAILAYGSQLLPLTLLGAPIEVIALLSVFTGINGMLQHANVAMWHGPLNWIFATADLHRWHHSSDFDASNTNFGSNLILWDVVFGTRDLPEGSPEEVGLAGVNLPENFFAHLASPFVLQRYSDPSWAEPPAVEAR
ncbi:MAG TPA: sterol desaturase family protein [Deltaproteobacteria bacterium]|nr:sterol desaturase family protein [Deltaproteobacteria bacterium]